MFHSLLESNGIEINANELYSYDDGINCVRFYRYIINGNKYWDVYLEQACLQYCIENGVKRNHLHEIGIDINNNGITYLSNMTMDKEDANRLWCLILGYDIKII